MKIIQQALVAALIMLTSCQNKTQNNNNSPKTTDNSVLEIIEETPDSKHTEASKIKNLSYTFKSFDEDNNIISATVYIKDYGKTFCMDYKHGEMTMRNIFKDGYLYALNFAAKTATKIKLDDEEEALEMIPGSLSFMDEQEKALMKSMKVGTATIAGKKCDIYSFTDPESNYEGKYYIWNDFILKAEVQENSFEITEFSDKPNFPADVFNIPSDFVVNDISILAAEAFQ